MHTLRFQYSTRLLLSSVLILGCYLACDGPTKRTGVMDVSDLLYPKEFYYEGTLCEVPLFGNEPEASYLAPLLVRFPKRDGNLDIIEGEFDHYLWFFGCIVPLPF
jgi:hypothetical protein